MLPHCLVPANSIEIKAHIPLRAVRCKLPMYPRGGAELSDDSPGNRPVSKAGGTPCGTVGDVDLELVAVIQAWAELPESVKRAVLKMVRE